MTPTFSQATDPIFLFGLNLVDRINRNETVVPLDERIRLRALFDQAQALLGSSPEWELAKYALVSWIDEVLVDLTWEGRDWWSNNVLEVEMFNTRLCNERFFLKAKEAEALFRRDALEVFYDCVLLGFRGLYRDADLAEPLIRVHELPSDLTTWLKQARLSIRVGQGRPPLAAPRHEIRGAPPVAARAWVIWSWLTAVMLATTNILYFVLYRTPDR